MSQQISASNGAENLRLDRTEKVDAVFVSSHAASRNQIIPSHIHKGYFFFFLTPVFMFNSFKR